MLYDLCVVGAGLIGSSAARHAALDPACKVCLVGPQEPKSRKGHTIFGAHYDEGRITRSTANDIMWAIVSSRSISRYRELEHETGIHFYDEVGCLLISEQDDDYITKTHQSALKQNIQPLLLSASELRARFPYLRCNNDRAYGMLETNNAGYINPRALLKVEQTVALRAGCHIFTDVVKTVTHVMLDGAPAMKVQTDSGLELYTRKVLLATGAFTEARTLLPPGVQLDLTPVSQAVIFAELSTEDTVRFRDMPSMLCKSCDLSSVAGTAESTHDYDCYILPPITYPDGKTYIKLGHGSEMEYPLTSPTEIVDYFTKLPPEGITAALKRIFSHTFPDLKPVSLHTDTCVTVNTPTGRIYIDLITPQLGIALGGNGCSAKCCDELGRLAASMLLTGTWTDEQLPWHLFRMKLKQQPVSSRL